jgi:hypothetical protein
VLLWTKITISLRFPPEKVIKLFAMFDYEVMESESILSQAIGNQSTCVYSEGDVCVRIYDLLQFCMLSTFVKRLCKFQIKTHKKVSDWGFPFCIKSKRRVRDLYFWLRLMCRALQKQTIALCFACLSRTAITNFESVCRALCSDIAEIVSVGGKTCAKMCRTFGVSNK